jgi:uncharacterized secreted protein with C-terminal beta-propeller domain
VAAAAVALTLTAAGCGLSAVPTERVALDAVTPVAALAPFDSCEGLLEHLRQEALERVGPYGLEDPLIRLPFEEALPAEDLAAAAGEDLTGSEASSDPGVSSTNVQEEGVDEPDLIKADRDRLVVVTEDELVIVDPTGNEPAVTGRLALPDGFDHELFVVDDHALVLTRTDGGLREPEGASAGGWEVSTRLTGVDLADPTAPAVTRILDVEGSYVSARMQGGVARVVVSRPVPDLGFVQPADVTVTAERQATAVNRAVIEESELDDWLPAWTTTGAGDDDSGRLGQCDAVHRPAEFAGFGMVSVLTVELDSGPIAPQTVSVLGAGETVYASAGHLYVATQRVEDPAEAEPDEPTAAPADPAEEIIDIVPPALDVHTDIHRFTAPAEGPVAYEASGAVEGRLLNQFSLSEHDEVLRVATTRGEPWAAGASDSLVTTLARAGDRLVEQGRVEGLGQGEEIYAVRFVGPVGYVVTFRQTDPLYVIDLRDPGAPTVEGELKIPGYSAYLHPVDDTHVLGVGQDADEQGRTSGTQVSLFDVSDPTAPERTAQVSLPGTGSEVEWDHRAFLWWAPDRTAVVPVEGAGPGGALVLEVDATGTTLAERGLVEHGSSPLRRSVVIDRTLVTMDAGGLVFSGLDDLAPRASLAL